MSACARCARPLGPGSAYVLGSDLKCLGCAFRHGPMLRRSVLTALVVGTVPVLINQGPEILAGSPPVSLIWKVPLTYAIPLLVAT